MRASSLPFPLLSSSSPRLVSPWNARTRLAPLAHDRRRHFSRSARLLAPELDHYATLGVPKSASRNEIKNKFYELSKKYHPDAPSVSSESVETRTARFQTLSQSYSVLSDDTSRRQYDAMLSGGGGYGSRPRYTSGAAHEVGRSGFGGGAGAAWSSGENHARRERANYAWAHPQRHRRASADEAADAAGQRSDPFAQRKEYGQTRSSDEHFQTFAAREARRRGRMAAGGFTGAGSRFASGTASFGAKAEEESRLINDSSTKRSGQVFFIFAATFFLAWSFSGGHERHAPSSSEKQRRR